MECLPLVGVITVFGCMEVRMFVEFSGAPDMGSMRDRLGLNVVGGPPDAEVSLI